MKIEQFLTIFLDQKTALFLQTRAGFRERSLKINLPGKNSAILCFDKQFLFHNQEYEFDTYTTKDTYLKCSTHWRKFNIYCLQIFVLLYSLLLYTQPPFDVFFEDFSFRMCINV